MNTFKNVNKALSLVSTINGQSGNYYFDNYVKEEKELELNEFISSLSSEEREFYKAVLPFESMREVSKSGCNQPVYLAETEHVTATIFLGDRCNLADIKVRTHGELAELTVKWLEQRYPKTLVEHSDDIFIPYTMTRKQYGS